MGKPSLRIGLLFSGLFFPGILFPVLFLISSCNRTNNPANAVPFVYLAPRQGSGELVVMRKPGTSLIAFNRWLDSVRTKFGEIHIYKICSNCDSSLISLTGPGAYSYISQETASGGNGTRGGGGPSGDDGPVYYSVNFPISVDDTIEKSSQFPLPLMTTTTKRAVTVAIFDTGIDPDKIPNEFLYTSTKETCLTPGNKNGWNFANNNSNFTDDHAGRHGTVVSGFILNQVYQYNNNSVKLLPVKIHDSTGKSNLFDVLCGFSYAVDRGAEIINASFGFYAPRYLAPSSIPDSSGFLLKKYIERYLIPAHVLLIAASGNRNDPVETGLFSSVSPISRRNLDFVSFYPASLARDMSNVIAVTTVNSTMPAPNQNYSPGVVDVGVYADNTTNFTFASTLDSRFSVIGSSFATPIATGKICANYYLIEGLLAGPFTKNQIWENLGLNIAPRNSDLEGRILRSRIMKK